MFDFYKVTFQITTFTLGIVAGGIILSVLGAGALPFALGAFAIGTLGLVSPYLVDGISSIFDSIGTAIHLRRKRGMSTKKFLKSTFEKALANDEKISKNVKDLEFVFDKKLYRETLDLKHQSEKMLVSAAKKTKLKTYYEYESEYKEDFNFPVTVSRLYHDDSTYDWFGHTTELEKKLLELEEKSIQKQRSKTEIPIRSKNNAKENSNFTR